MVMELVGQAAKVVQVEEEGEATFTYMMKGIHRILAASQTPRTSLVVSKWTGREDLWMVTVTISAQGAIE